MHVAINYWAVVLAAIVGAAVGAVWYARPVFGGPWMKLAGLHANDKPSFQNMAPLLMTQLALSLLTAYILAHFVFFVHYFTGDEWLRDGVNAALWAWLGFTACRLATHDMFEGRRKKLTLLNAAYEVVALVAMGAVIGWLHP